MSALEMDTGRRAPPGTSEAPVRATERRLFAGLLATRPPPMVNKPPAANDNGQALVEHLIEMGRSREGAKALVARRQTARYLLLEKVGRCEIAIPQTRRIP